VNEVSEEIFFFVVEDVLEGQFLPERPFTPLDRARGAEESGKREDEDGSDESME
jgi:hypothetical protein